MSCLACVPCLQYAPHSSASLLGMYLIMSYGHLRTFSSFPSNISVAYLVMVRLLHAEDGLPQSGPGDPPYFVFLHATLPSMSDIPTNSPHLEDKPILSSLTPPFMLCTLCSASCSREAERAVTLRRHLLSGHKQAVYAGGCHSCIE